MAVLLATGRPRPLSSLLLLAAVWISFLCGGQAFGLVPLVRSSKLIAVQNGSPSQQRSVADRTTAAAVHRSSSQPRGNVIVLNMGIRSFLGGLTKRKKDEDDEEDSSSGLPWETSASSQQQDDDAPAKAETQESKTPPKKNKKAKKKSDTAPPSTPKPVRMGQDPTTGEVNVHALDKYESVQERINRVKSGQMTEEEKEAFLQTALSAGPTPESRKPLRPPGIESSEQYRAKGVASPFPSDSILRNFARGQEAPRRKSSAERLLDNAQLDSQKKKREYLDMVTNPDRFYQYKSSSSSTSSMESSTTTEDDVPSEEAEPNISLERSSSSVDQKDQQETAPAAASASPTSDMPEDLGARLGAAAMATESLRQEQERLRQEQERLKTEEERLAEQKREEERLEQELRAQEAARQQQAEMARREQELQERRRQEEERVQQEKEKEQAREKERLEQLMKAQEEYWTKKLAAERDQKLAKQQREAEAEEPENPPTTLTSDVEVTEATATGTAKTQPESTTFNPDESNLLEDALHDKEDIWDHNQETIARKAAEIRGTQPSLNDVRSERRFMDERSERKREIDRMHDEQLERLKSLNSPLPTPPVDKGRPPTYPPALQQDRTVPRSAVSTVAGKAAFNPQKPPSVNDSSSKEGGDSTTVPTANVKKTERPSKLPEPSAWSRLVANQQEKKKNADVATPKSVSNSPVKSNPTPDRRGPIRMPLPLDSDDDDEEGIYANKSKPMSVAEAAKRTTEGGKIGQGERSKKWGIDMSRFMDD